MQGMTTGENNSTTYVHTKCMRLEKGWVRSRHAGLLQFIPESVRGMISSSQSRRGDSDGTVNETEWILKKNQEGGSSNGVRVTEHCGLS